MDDRRAHDRIDKLESTLQNHLIEHSRFEADLKKNTALTQEIADNTGELVSLFKGVKGLRTLVIWGAPIIAALAALVVYIREWK